MTVRSLPKFVAASLLALSLAVVPSTLSASAQTSGGTSQTQTTDGTNETDTRTAATTDDRDFDWGWLGLIGLAGLAGLARKPETVTRYRDSQEMGTRPRV